MLLFLCCFIERVRVLEKIWKRFVFSFSIFCGCSPGPCPPFRPPIPFVASGPVFSGLNDYCQLDSPDVEGAAGSGTGAGVFGVLCELISGIQPSLEVVLASDAVITVVFLSSLAVPFLRFCPDSARCTPLSKLPKALRLCPNFQLAFVVRGWLSIPERVNLWDVPAVPAVQFYYRYIGTSSPGRGRPLEVASTRDLQSP